MLAQDEFDLLMAAALAEDANCLEEALSRHPALSPAEADQRAADLAPVLLTACEQGLVTAVRVLCEHGARPTPSVDGEWGPLCMALAAGHDEVAEVLLEFGAPITAHAAAALGDLARLEALVAENPDLVGARGPAGAEPLHLAATVPVARRLLSFGADPLALDCVHANTPARWAVADRRRQSVARYLAAFDPPTALCLAIMTNDTASAAQLLDEQPGLLQTCGSPTDLLTSGTPLHLAVERCSLESARLLLERGADPNRLSGYGHAPLHVAAMCGDRDLVTLLLAAGADGAARDQHCGQTPAQWAARFGQTHLADLLGA